MRVGIFDSGIGGLSVLHRAMKMLPNTEFVYYADKDHVPYGEKTVEEIRNYIAESLWFLVEKNVDAIVIACNTATVVATKEFRSQFPVPIVGMEPAVKKAVEEYQDTNKRILVTATPITIAGEKLHNLLERVDKKHLTDLLPLPKLVRFAEKGDFQSEEIEEYLREALQDFVLEDYTALVLGCTHFNYFKKQFCKLFPNEIHFVDGNEGAIRQLMRILPQEEEERTQCAVYYYSGREVNAEERQQIEQYMKQLDIVYDI